jgi:hypothetical protein
MNIKGGGIMNKFPGVKSKNLKNAMRKIVPEAGLREDIMEIYRRGDGEDYLKTIELYEILYGSE